VTANCPHHWPRTADPEPRWSCGSPAGWFATAQWYAEAGFAVVIADGRGTPGRGPAWEKTVHHDTLSAPLEDQVTALQAAAEY
jgi:dipeptidyl aminopeptidase/acylaminoacyl peptidase